MKDSTKEYLTAGALFTWGLTKTLVSKAINPSSSTYNYSNVQTARGAQAHWDRAQALREQEKIEEQEVSETISVGSAFRLPEGFCEGANGKVWRVKQISGTRILLCKHGKHDKEFEHWFLYKDIKQHYESWMPLQPPVC